jgi:hypothetical protein
MAQALLVTCRMRLLLVVVGCGAIACGGAPVMASASTPTASQLLVNAREASANRWVDLTAHSADGALVLEQIFLAPPGSAETQAIRLDRGTYQLDARVYADGDRSAPLGEAARQIVIDSPVFMKLNLPNGAGPSLSSDRGPIVDRVDISLDGAGRAVVSAQAADPDDDSLMFFWGSAAVTQIVQPVSVLTIEPSAAAIYSPTAHLVVQDPAGATASATVIFPPQRDCPLCATPHITTAALPDADEPCAIFHAECIAQCDASGEVADAAQCASACGATLALCRTDP